MAAFWGLRLNRGLRYSKVVNQSFHISAATLDTTSCEDDIVSVLFENDDQEYVLCNLSLKHNVLQVPLDLQFCEGDRITFSLHGGKGDVVLSGYNLLDTEEDPEIDDEVEVEEIPKLVTIKGKRKRELVEDKTKSPKVDAKKPKIEKVEESSKEILTKNQRRKLKKKEKVSESPVSPIKNKNSTKKTENKNSSSVEKKESPNINLAALLMNGNEADSDDEDEDFTLEGVEEESEGEEEELLEEEEGGEEEDDDDDDDDDDDEEEEEDDDDDDEEEDEEEEGNLSSPVKKGLGPAPPSSAGRTPMVKLDKKSRKQQETSTPPKQTPKPEKENSFTETPKSKKKKNKENNKTPDSKQMSNPPQSEGKKSLKVGGVLCEDMKFGMGAEAKNGKMVSVYYEGRLKNGKLFDKQLVGPHFQFRLGSNEVIKAWDVGIQGMKVGGKRRITAPPNMAYGKKGAPPSIPPNSFLVFEVELKAVH